MFSSFLDGGCAAVIRHLTSAPLSATRREAESAPSRLSNVRSVTTVKTRQGRHRRVHPGSRPRPAGPAAGRPARPATPDLPEQVADWRVNRMAKQISSPRPSTAIATEHDDPDHLPQPSVTASSAAYWSSASCATSAAESPGAGRGQHPGVPAQSQQQALQPRRVGDPHGDHRRCRRRPAARPARSGSTRRPRPRAGRSVQGHQRGVGQGVEPAAGQVAQGHVVLGRRRRSVTSHGGDPVQPEGPQPVGESSTTPRGSRTRRARRPAAGRPRGGWSRPGWPRRR